MKATLSALAMVLSGSNAFAFTAYNQRSIVCGVATSATQLKVDYTIGVDPETSALSTPIANYAGTVVPVFSIRLVRGAKVCIEGMVTSGGQDGTGAGIEPEASFLQK